ncbi:uncharacterized protein LOC126680774 [Mercurialis annua]|uniref:uncharacterized protein LOC126680774 n=1 Tax=Mercurialis annua TaxID=3986 RepID=UPI00215E12C2|nr:uncharacterized protein LOC126680774 [Mercurialis annua]
MANNGDDRRSAAAINADDDDFLTLSLTFGSPNSPAITTATPHQEPQLLPNPNLNPSPFLITSFSFPFPSPNANDNNPPAPPPRQRARRNPTQTLRDHARGENIPPPFPWATNRRAVVYNLDSLRRRNINVISGLVQCKRCERQYEMGFNLKEKFFEVGRFIAENRNSMHDRAPGLWMTPVLPTCQFCEQENSVKPVISEKKKNINWLFLFLGQMLGCCTLEQLKYFCKHTKNHRTGAKDRVLYLTYLSLCKQLYPSGPFNIR